MNLNFKKLTKNFLKNYIIYLTIFLLLVFVGIYSISKIDNKYKYEIGLMVGTNNTENYIYKCSKLIKTDIVLNDIKENLNLNYSIEEIKRNIIVNYDIKSDYISVILTFKEKELLLDISDELVNSLKEHSKILYDVDNIYIVIQSEIKIINNKNIYKILVFIFSLLISFVISVIVYLYRNFKKYNKLTTSYKTPIIRKIE